ncbi:MAG: cupin domain-containing protein [Cyanobacteria bacterium P01_F01_bin.150]
MNAPDMTPQDASNAEFTDRATDYALNFLTDGDATDVSIKNDISDATLAEEMAELQAAIAAIPYSTPPVPLSSDLKTRLFERIEETPSSQAQSSLFHLLTQSINDLKQKSEGLAWQLLPGMENGAMAIYEIDQDSRSVAFFVRATTAEVFPNHHHAAGEEVLVLAGDFVVDEQVYSPGDRIFSHADTAHQPRTTQGCLLFCVSSLDDKMI